jgi:hypothetical protein
MNEGNQQSEADGKAWEVVLTSLCRLQGMLPDAVLVGGTAAALYAGHRFSFDHDHVLMQALRADSSPAARQARTSIDSWRDTWSDTWRDARASGQTQPPFGLPRREP